MSKRARRALIAWALLIATFCAIWIGLAPSDGPHPRTTHAAHATASSPPDDSLTTYVLVLPSVAFFAVLSWLVFSGRRATRKLLDASRLLALPDLAPAERAFVALGKSRRPVTAATALLNLASIVSTRTQFEEAITYCDRAMDRVGNAYVARELLLPELRARRAYALAALGRHAEASQQLANMEAMHPGYALLAPAKLRVRLMQAVKAEDLAAARDVAKQRTLDLPLGLHDELLADALLATGEERPPHGEVERLCSELRSDAELGTWLRAVWPAGQGLLEQAAARTRAA